MLASISFLLKHIFCAYTSNKGRDICNGHSSPVCSCRICTGASNLGCSCLRCMLHGLTKTHNNNIVQREINADKYHLLVDFSVFIRCCNRVPDGQLGPLQEFRNSVAVFIFATMAPSITTLLQTSVRRSSVTWQVSTQGAFPPATAVDTPRLSGLNQGIAVECRGSQLKNPETEAMRRLSSGTANSRQTASGSSTLVHWKT